MVGLAYRGLRATRILNRCIHGGCALESVREDEIRREKALTVPHVVAGAAIDLVEILQFARHVLERGLRGRRHRCAAEEFQSILDGPR